MTRRDLIFRVFVSSTFSDLKEERNALQEKTFPELRKYCRDRGARFQAIDLRWGISQEAALDQLTMNICFEEIARCQALSPKPNFIVLLGDRYGWRPLPAQIETDEFDSLLAQLSDQHQQRLKTWYRRDDNAEPAEYCLLPRTGEFEDPDRWVQEENILRAILREAVQHVIPANDLEQRKYEDSATHQEIRAGALEVQDPQNHVFCYFREINGLPEDESAARYRDVVDGKADKDAGDRLRVLKAELGGDDKHKSLLPPENVHTYPASWQKGVPVYDRRDLCHDVERDLKRIIDRELAAFKQKPGLDREREAHREFAEERCRHFVSRKETLHRIQAYIDSDDRYPLVIHGQSGSGKTAVLAKAVGDLGLRSSKPEVKIISRFVGATPGSSDLRSLLDDLCGELDVGEIPQDMNELVRTFRAQLSPSEDISTEDEEKENSTGVENVVLFLDALDQLNPTDNARMLYWLPRELKPNVKLILSVLEGGRQGQPQIDDVSPGLASSPQSAFRTPHSLLPEDPFDIARRIWPESLLEIGALDVTSGAELLDAWLKEAGRTLQGDQKEEVLAQFSKCPLPLYLKLAFEEARRWKSWEGVATSLSDTVEGILGRLLMRLERPENHGETLVTRALGYIATGKNGLTEDELIDLLSRKDSGVVREFLDRSPESPKVDRLPIVVWSRLFADIQPYMASRRADGTVVMAFYHRQVREAIRKRYLSTEEALVEAHLHLAEYFHGLDYWAESLEAQRARAKRLPPTPRPANIRKVVELPYHRLEASKIGGKGDPKSPYWDTVADLFTDWQFLEAKTEADPNFREQESVDPAQKSGENKP